jgi:hypothetical protein
LNSFVTKSFVADSDKQVSNSSLFTDIFSANGAKSSTLNHSQPHLVLLYIKSIYSIYFSHQATFSTHFAASASI